MKQGLGQCSTSISLQGYPGLDLQVEIVTIKGTRDEPQPSKSLPLHSLFSLDLLQTHLEVPTCAGLQRGQTTKIKITQNPTDWFQVMRFKEEEPTEQD